MIASRTIGAAEAMGELELYAYALRKQKVRAEIKDRIQFLSANPGAVELDDFDALRDCDGRQRRWLFEQHPELKQQYEEHQDSPEKVLGSVHEFARRCFRHCGLGDKFKDNWHIRALCEEWEAIVRYDHLRTMINQPPDTSKSFLANIVVPAYAMAKDPNWSCIEVSYNFGLPKRDGETLLKLMNSDWYRRRFPATRIKSGNGMMFETTAGGFRRGTSVGTSITGWHPRLIVFDDPHRAADVVNSPRMMRKVLSYYASTIPSRGSGMSQSETRRTGVVIVMQRLSQGDLCGMLLGEDSFSEISGEGDLLKKLDVGFKWRHVCLPMFYDPNHPYLYEHDPRTQHGEMLLSNVTEQEIRSRMKEMEMDPEAGGQTTTAQYGQNPMASNNSLFDGLDVAYIGGDDIRRLRLTDGTAVRCWDRADSTTGDSTAGVLMVLLDGVYYILDVITFQKRHAERDQIIEDVARMDRQKFHNYRVGIERAPGPDGQSAFDATFKRLKERCFVQAMAVPAIKSKEDRAQPLAASLKYGECKVIDGKKWKPKFHAEMMLFPNGKHDDIVDASSGAMWVLNRWSLGAV